MKKRFLTLLLIVFVVCSFALLGGCKGQGGSNPIIGDENVEEVQQMSLNKINLSLEKMEEYLLIATVDGQTVNDAVWSSSNDAVATVTNGKVSAVGGGYAVIIATYGESEARCPVSVSDNKLIPGITTNVTNDVLYLLPSDYFDLTYYVTYNSKVVDDATVSVNIESADGSVSFSDNKITANKVSENGSAIVTINANWHGLTAKETFEVCVVNNATATLSSERVINIYNDKNAGDTTFKLTPELMVNDQVLSADEFTLSNWKYDEKIVEIDENNYTVKGLSKGTAKISATFTVKETGLTVDSVVTVGVGLYTYDKSDIILDILYLNQDKFLLIRNDIYGDVNQSALDGWTINAVTDVTDSTTYPIEVYSELSNGDALIDIADVKALGVSGDRKWQIDCDKYSYIVTVPIVEKHAAKPLAGTYFADDLDYKVKISFANNKDKIEFIDVSSGAVIETATYTVTEWKSPDSGVIRITTKGQNICSTGNIEGFFYVSNGVRQINMFLDASYGSADKHVTVYNGETPEIEFSVVGEYKNASFAYSIKLEENGACTFNSAFAGVINGEYSFLSQQNKIFITLDKAIKGQTEFEGKIAGTNMILSIDGEGEKTFAKEVVSDGPVISADNEKFAGVYRSNDRPWIYLGEDGTFVFAFPHYSTDIGSTGTYTLDNGVITINITAGWYKGTHTGTYFEQGGKTVINVKIVYDSNYELVK